MFAKLSDVPQGNTNKLWGGGLFSAGLGEEMESNQTGTAMAAHSLPLSLTVWSLLRTGGGGKRPFGYGTEKLWMAY